MLFSISYLYLTVIISAFAGYFVFLVCWYTGQLYPTKRTSGANEEKELSIPEKDLIIKRRTLVVQSVAIIISFGALLISAKSLYLSNKSYELTQESTKNALEISKEIANINRENQNLQKYVSENQVDFMRLQERIINSSNGANLYVNDFRIDTVVIGNPIEIISNIISENSIVVRVTGFAAFSKIIEKSKVEFSKSGQRLYLEKFVKGISSFANDPNYIKKSFRLSDSDHENIIIKSVRATDSTINSLNNKGTIIYTWAYVLFINPIIDREFLLVFSYASEVINSRFVHTGLFSENTMLDRDGKFISF